jgi:hypothetical protein
MNAITENDLAEDHLASAPDGPRAFTLRRTGKKALRFAGWRMVEAVGSGDQASMWYDLTLYRSDAGAIIVELIARRRLLDEQDLSHVEVFGSLREAASWLEDYPCGNEVPIPAALAAGQGPMAAAILHSVQLRQRIGRIADDYHCLLSDVFEILDITDTPSLPQAEKETLAGAPA